MWAREWSSPGEKDSDGQRLIAAEVLQGTTRITVGRRISKLKCQAFIIISR